jgi:superfamily II DNA/RNA helicase
VRDVAPAIVFTRTKHGADRLVRQLRLDGIAAATIHGDRTQGQRERALAGFRAGEVTTLVATDVAARGIHVDDVAVVVHYDLAGSDKDYQHRSGRTGRAGSSGLVVTLVGADQHDDTATIQRSLDMPAGLHDIDMSQLTATEEPELAHAFAARASNGAGAGGRGRSNQGKGNGERTRARPQRTQARRGQGSSRSR